MEIRLHDGTKIVLSWVRKGLLDVALLQPGHLGRPNIHLLRGSKLIEGRELRALKAMLQDEGEPEITLPPAA